MKKFATVAAAIAAFGFVNAASAADMPVKAPMAAPMATPLYNWTGFYIGINGGGGWGREDWLDNTNLPTSGTTPISHSPSGGVFGGQLGYRWQMNQFVFGIEGTWDWAGLSETVVTNPGFLNEDFKVKSIYTVTGQVGWAFDRWLPYVKGGWAGATTSFDLSGILTASNSQTNSGWTVGGGLDYALWQNFILGVEYDHIDLNYGTFNAPVSNGGTPTIVTNTSRLKIDQVVARLSYKFWTP